MSFGNVTQAHVGLRDLTVSLSDFRATRARAPTRCRRGISISAALRTCGSTARPRRRASTFATSSRFFISTRCRFSRSTATSRRTRASISCSAAPRTSARAATSTFKPRPTRALNLLGEKFDEGHADFEYRWIDRLAGIDGAEIDIRSLSLTKVKKEGRARSARCSARRRGHRGGDMRGSLVVQGSHSRARTFSGRPRRTLEGRCRASRASGESSRLRHRGRVNVTPVRIMGAAFGGSDLHVAMVRRRSRRRSRRQTRVAGPIMRRSTKRRTCKASVQGEYTVDGRALRRSGPARRRRRDPPESAGHPGKVELSSFDLGPIGKLVTRVRTTPDGVHRRARRRDLRRSRSSASRRAISRTRRCASARRRSA